jgi:hypothetical protein
VGALYLVGEAGRRHVAGEVRAAVNGRGRQVRELLKSHLSALELRGQNAASNPRLVAALSGRVRAGDAAGTCSRPNPGGKPVRESFSHTYVATPGEAPVFITGKKELKLDLGPLVARALQTRWAASAVLQADGWPFVVVAVPVALPNSTLSPVLALVAPIEPALMSKMAEGTGGAVLVSDGRRPLLGAGSVSETTRLRQVLGHESEGSVSPASGEAAVAVVPMTAGLWLLAHVDPAPIAARAATAHAAIRIAVGSVGGVVFVLLLGWIWRGVRAAALAVPLSAPAPAPAIDESGPGRYVMLNRLGGGGMAEVYLAVAVGERGFRRPCVVKRLRPELAANPVAVSQFTDEATLASSLVHANIVPIFDFTKVGNDFLLVEEYIVGRDLGKLVRRAQIAGRILSPALLATIGVEALKALEYAHGKRDHDGLPMGIVHRDVSPENIMVTVRGEVQLLDFGVMKVTYGQGGRTEIGELKGNITFMAPEQARGLDVDARADLFALGSVLYFCLRAEPLYGNETGYDLLVKAASGPGPEEMAKIEALPAPLNQVLARALAPRREDRFANAAEFSEALRVQALAAGTDIGALVHQLFGDELNLEQQQLAASSISMRGASALTPTPWRPIRGDLGR